MRRARLACAVGLSAWLLAATAEAHKPSDSYLTLRPIGSEVIGRWDIALRDLEDAIGVDGDGDGVVTWGEVRARCPDVLAFALPRLSLRSAGRVCTVHAGSEEVVRHADGTYLALPLTWRCEAPATDLSIHYELFFERDAAHRGITRVIGQSSSQALVFTTRDREKQVNVEATSSFSAFASTVKLGVQHIWSGYDHLLFLLALLLPAVLRREGKRWLPVVDFEPTFKEVLRTITAFTLAHSVTLALAVLGVVELPSRWVESAIALSVVLAAANNLWPVVRADRWVAAFELGLLHGFGFATALADVGLEGRSLATTLFGFNLGVEIGQLTIVSALLPLAYLARRRPGYARWALGGGSAAVAVVASVWLVERAFALRIIS